LQFVGVEHDTPAKLADMPFGFGLVITDQLVPFQCSTNVFCVWSEV
jgi:hypothetical protein